LPFYLQGTEKACMLRMNFGRYKQKGNRLPALWFLSTVRIYHYHRKLAKVE